MRRHDGALTGGPVPPATPNQGQSGSYEYLTGPGGAPVDSRTPYGTGMPTGHVVDDASSSISASQDRCETSSPDKAK